MYRTRITFEVLTEQPIHPNEDLESIVRECDEGDYVMGDVERVEVELSGKEMAEALIAAGSDPEFFQLDAEGRKHE